MQFTSNIYDAQAIVVNVSFSTNLLTQCGQAWSRACINENGCGGTWQGQQTNIRQSLVTHFACWLITCWQDALSIHAACPRGSCPLVCDLLINKYNVNFVARWFETCRLPVYCLTADVGFPAYNSATFWWKKVIPENRLLVNYPLAYVSLFLPIYTIFVVVRWFVTCRHKGNNFQ